VFDDTDFDDIEYSDFDDVEYPGLDADLNRLREFRRTGQGSVGFVRQYMAACEQIVARLRAARRAAQRVH
jgi:hypothetical protein